MYEICQFEGVKFAKITDFSQTSAQSYKLVAQNFARDLGLEAVENPLIFVNDTSEMLGNDVDYIFVFQRVPFVNLGCCIFRLEDIKNKGEESALRLLESLYSQIFSMQPREMQKYAKACVRKKNEAYEKVAQDMLSNPENYK
ncbi:hypothetical protein CQA49_00090 [Helicobacter sp. MIT 00-7814]|uniref:hypothetical protein n=1 Tax=unclassified Helicobacter TaxID=2593540 RepID=UPI000E1E80D3|nr:MULTISPECIES: hypothetical protein [unclassified Helicobacter]RDU57104.1 hypothetical protein CQA49_00090 [Helicobacter sp. MIT 00-7814]RDU57655.1 hypothetical protein CQA37_00090 [Helicobacter sp. MIT 99-10781]